MNDSFGLNNNMVMLPLQADLRPNRLAWFKCRQPFGAAQHSSDEIGELLQWLGYGDSITDIDLVVVVVFIIIFWPTSTKPQARRH